MSLTTLIHYVRVVLIAALLWSVGGRAAPLAIPDFPLFLTSLGVPPNLVMTIDNSGSMTRSWMPDDVDSFMNTTDLPRFASSSVNGMYYNPKITYPIPTRSDGISYSTSFTAAWFNGFDTSKGPSSGLNLGTSYKVVKQSQPSDTYSSATFVTSTGEAAFYYLFYLDKSSSTAKPTNCDGTRTDNDCYIKIVVGGTNDIAAGDATAQKQNFANWYSFYRTRVMAVMSGAMTAITGVKTKTATTTEENGTIRFGWQTINGGCDISPGTACPGYGTTTTTTTHTATCNVTFTKAGSRRRGYTYTIATTTTTAPCNAFFADIPDSTTVTVSGITGSYSSYNKNYTVASGLSDISIRVNETFDTNSFSNVGLSWTETKTVPVTAANRLKTLDLTQKTNFYNWLQRINVSGWTPMRSALKRAGEYYKVTGQDSPYAENPYVSEGTVRACRGNFHVLFTDGLWNQDCSGSYCSSPRVQFQTPGSNTDPDSSGTTTLGNSSDTPTPAITSYSPRAPYKDVNVTPGGSTYSNANDLADTAFYYWANDLYPGLANALSPNMIDFSGDSKEQFWNPKNDPATWQHMVNYAIGLGLSQTLVKDCNYSESTDDPNNPKPGCPVWTGSTYTGGYDGLKAGTLNWPKINQSSVGDDPDGHVYDLWHMAINSRGKFYSADNPDDLVKAFKDVINTISSAAASGGGARVSSNVARITESNPTAFVARFNADWSGTLQAFPIDPEDGTLGTTAYWEAGSLISPGNSTTSPRKIFTWNGSSGQEFTLTGTNACPSISNLQTVLNKKADGTVDNLCPERLVWLRGYTAITGASWNSSTQIVTFTAPKHGLKVGDKVVVTGVTSRVTVSGVTSDSVAYNGAYTVATIPDINTFTAVETITTDPGTYVAETGSIKDDRVRYANFRDRSSVLGDIMNSGTVYAHKEDFGYGGDNIAVTGGKTAYKTYVTGKASRTPVVYVGANDGMLHAFNAEISGANMGKELFAYVPAGVYDYLNTLTDLDYIKSHKYFVDGTPTVGDAYIGGVWKTYLVGGLRAGGKSIYALDVSNTNSFAETNVKWEFTDTGYLGLTFGQPQITAINKTQWAAVFGNGYNSTNEDAVLYVVDLSNGTLIARIRTFSAPSTSTSPANGLSTPYPFDSDGDGIVDAIYAGDLYGNLWKFEKNNTLTDSTDLTSGTWVLGNGGNPVFTTPRVSGQVTQTITTQPNAKLIDGKVMIYFGTGSYLVASDLTNDHVQTFYGVWDDPATTSTVSRADMLAQTLSTVDLDPSPTVERLGRVVSANTLSTSNKGCYLDFPATSNHNPPIPSERIASSSLIKLFTTAGLDTRVIFTTSTPTSDPCERSGTSWLMEVSTSCGRLGGTSPFDINKDEKFDTLDLVTVDNQQVSVSGLELKKQTGIVSEITWVEGDTTKGIAYKLLPGSSGQVESIANSSDTGATGGSPPKRIYWEQIQ